MNRENLICITKQGLEMKIPIIANLLKNGYEKFHQHKQLRN